MVSDCGREGSQQVSRLDVGVSRGSGALYGGGEGLLGLLGEPDLHQLGLQTTSEVRDPKAERGARRPSGMLTMSPDGAAVKTRC